MKLIAVILILYVVSCEAYYDSCSGANLKDIVLRCIAGNGATNGDLTDLLSSKYAKNKNARCFRACVFLSCQYFHPDGRLYANVPKRLSLLLGEGQSSKTETTEQIANYCLYATRTYQSVCDTTEAFMECMIKLDPTPVVVRGVF